MIRITLGSVENVVVDVTDQTNAITALPGATTYDLVRNSDGVKVASNLAATNISGMRCECRINTGTPGFQVGRYTLFVRFPTLTEVPVLRVGDIEVN